MPRVVPHEEVRGALRAQKEFTLLSHNHLVFNCKTIRALLLRKMWKSTSSFVAVFWPLFLIVTCEGKASICSGTVFLGNFLGLHGSKIVCLP